jgi:predicted  nucleic acid-binding Zn-ribbon protein
MDILVSTFGNLFLFENLKILYFQRVQRRNKFFCNNCGSENFVGPRVEGNAERAQARSARRDSEIQVAAVRAQERAQEVRAQEERRRAEAVVEDDGIVEDDERVEDSDMS